MSKTCAFSGHRNLNYGDFDIELLDRVIHDLIKTGVDCFLNGMALGFDLVSAEIVLKYKKQYAIKLTACIPCANQSERFSEKNKERYNKILAECDDIITLYPIYRTGCMHERDRYMVDNSDILLCYLRKQTGGTFYTVNYAKKQGRKIIEI